MTPERFEAELDVILFPWNKRSVRERVRRLCHQVCKAQHASDLTITEIEEGTCYALREAPLIVPSPENPV